MNYKKILSLLLACTLSISLCACGTQSDAGSTSNATSSSVQAAQATQYISEDEFTDRDLNGEYADVTATIQLSDATSTAAGNGVTIDNSTNVISITEEGIYIVSGTLSNGQIIVDANDAKVQLVLDNADIQNQSSAAIYASNADKLFITLAEESSNALSNVTSFSPDSDSNVDGVIFAKCDVTINGTGTLDINSCDHGVVSKDDLCVTGGTLNIASEGHGLSGKDSVRISSSDSITIHSSEDAIHSSNDEDEDKGYVFIADANLDITAGDDGIHAETDLFINDGKIIINESYEGLEGNTVTINGGDITINASDDGINAAGDASLTFGQSETPERGEMPGQGEMPERGEMPQQSEMPERGEMPQQGEMPERGEMPQQGEMPEHGEMPQQGEMPGRNNAFGGPMDSDDSCVITINGGTIYINAEGDGIDSNGILQIDGGEIYVDGPSSNGNSALDFGSAGYINGGSLVAVGSAGMAEAFSNVSEQNSVLINLKENGNAGDSITLCDAYGNTLLSFTAAKQFNCVQISCKELKDGETYTLQVGSQTHQIEL